MRAVVVEKHGGPEVLNFVEYPQPEPKPDQALIRVAVAGVNYIDVYFRTGQYPNQLPFVPGLEGLGEVVAVGPEVQDVRVGDRVGWAQSPRSCAEYVAVPAARLVPIPAEVADDIAAACLLQGATAHFLTHSTYPVHEGDTALVHAATGGVGLLLTQLVKHRGGRVLATVSTDEKEQLARQAGADEVLRYDDFAEHVRDLTNGAGVDVVYDGVSVATFDRSLASLRPRGTMVLYGAASGPVRGFDPQILNQRGSLFLTRPSLMHYIASREELLWRMSEVFSMVESGALRIRIGGRYPLADARRAHEDLESRRTVGKLLLTV